MMPGRRQILGAAAAGAAATVWATPTRAAAQAAGGGSQYIYPEDPYWDASPVAVGNGQADDTVALQHHINLMVLFQEKRPLFLRGRYRITAPIVVPRDVFGTPSKTFKMFGWSRHQLSGDANNSALPSTIVAGHGGDILRVDGEDVRIDGIAIRGQGAEGDASTVKVTFAGCRLTRCYFNRAGGKALVEFGHGGASIDDNYFVCHGAGLQYDPATGLAHRGHALWLHSVADTFVRGNEITGDGAGLRADSCGGVDVSHNLIYNSTQGVVLAGFARGSIHGNRIEEHAREGVVVDWNSMGNDICHNRPHNNGAWIANPDPVQRAGILVRSGSGNDVSHNVLDNWDHEVTQPGDLDFRSPQQYGIVVKQAAIPSPNRLSPRDNSLIGNLFRNQRTASIRDEVGETLNRWALNGGPDVPAAYWSP
jgi:hypothetical protein